MSELPASELFYVLLVFFYTDPLIYFLVDTFHVRSPAFDNPPSDDSDSDYSDHNSLWEVSSVSSVKKYDVSKLEAHLYYYGIRGPRRLGPKLIFRTSKDVFTAPSRPEQDSRLMQLLQVYEHEKLGNNDLWATIRSKVRDLLEAQQSAD